ncbi:MAG TPA: DUF2993 domain-containing protein [Frankiaceae bacterium]|nr:DUF2993 domain-containing protein [Frankiaceae bacterium]
MRKLLALGAVLLALVVVDRVAVGVAEDQIARRVQISQSLAEKPKVVVAGFPFLTQVVQGRYKQVTVVVPGLERDGLRLDQVRVVAEGVRVRLGDLINRTISSVPVDHASGQVLVTYDDLNAYLASRADIPKVQVSRAGADLKVTGSVRIPVLGKAVSLSGKAQVAISGENVALLPTAVSAVTGFLPGFAESSAKEALTIRFAIKGLPFGVRLDKATVTDEGITFSAFADGLTLDTQQ